jgi:hypothetical protein
MRSARPNEAAHKPEAEISPSAIGSKHSPHVETRTVLHEAMAEIGYISWVGVVHDSPGFGTERILPDRRFKVHGNKVGLAQKECIFGLKFILRMTIDYARTLCDKFC